MQKFFVTVVLTAFLCSVNAQNDEYPFPALSPKGILTQIVGNTTIDIEYERPSARNRQIFGALVPWNQVWRTGAGDCTKIRFDKSVVIGGQQIMAGTYSLHTIPNPTEWMIILNRDTTLYGSYGYDRNDDVARFTVPVNTANRYYEALTFDIEILPNDARIYISWTDVQVSFDVATSTDHEMMQFIETELLSEKNNESDIYAGAAEYLLYQDNDLEVAITLAEYAMELDEHNEWARSVKIQVLEKLGYYDKALAAMNQYIEYVKSRGYDDAQEKANLLVYLQTEYERIQGKKDD